VAAVRHPAPLSGGSGGAVNRPRPGWWVAVVWVAVLALLPAARGALGSEMLPNGLTAGVLALAATVTWVLAQDWGWRRALAAAGGALALTWLAEWVGSRYGLPFGSYHYTAQFQPQLLGVPLLIPLAWWMMLPPAWAVAAQLLGPLAQHRLAFAALSAVAFTAWDLLLDPQMVAWGFWSWSAPGGYFGVPWSNYLGWLTVAGLLSYCFGRRRLPTGPLLLVYGLTWSIQTAGQLFFWDQSGSGLVGGLVMGGLFAAALARRRSFF